MAEVVVVEKDGTLRSRALNQCWSLFAASQVHRSLCSFAAVEKTDRHASKNLLSLDEVEKILSDVKADNVQVIPVPKHCDFADYMVVATGRSAWHVRNIAQALIYKASDRSWIL